VNRVEQIRETLQQAFAPEHLAVHDDSHLHAGHAGAATGKGHFRVEIVSDAFAGLRPLQRHRAVYAALDALMQTEIHALSVSVRAPGEVAA
jgi:BolA family transcriptional regulator, general stress-responsive regulator